MQRIPFAPAVVATCVLALASSGCARLTDQFENLPRLTARDLSVELAQASYIYDNRGQLITSLYGVENRKVVRLRQVPEHVREAVIAIEDERFYSHEGVDTKAVFRALLQNASAGDIRQGGSTITQQYVKNVIIAPDGQAAKTIRRKIIEAWLARQLEKRLSKKQILERYLNTVYFGAGAYGIQAAARTFFGKSVGDLNVAQAATIAGLIRAPEEYDPFDNPAGARDRRDLVLAKMLQLGWITPKQHARSVGTGLGLEKKDKSEAYPAAYFVDYVRRLIKFDPRFEGLARTPNDREQLLLNGGLRVHTTLDLDRQRAAEEAVDAILTEERDPYGALVAIDPRTGYVEAMVGGRNFFDRDVKEDEPGKVNLATLAEPDLGPRKDGRKAPGTGRQGGSAFKVFALTQAIEEGVALSKRFDGGSPKVFKGANSGGDWRVQNYEGGAFGEISLAEATVKSVNTVFARLILDVGPEDVVELADEMGITTDVIAVPSAVLGSNEVNALGMASAYSTLAAGGTHRQPVAVTRIVDAKGKTIYRDEPDPQEVLDPAVAYLATAALEPVIERGTGTHAQIGRPAAGKTGTAQEYRDAWFAGYTPDLAAAVWIGHPHGQVEMQPCAVTHEIRDGKRTEVCRPARIGRVTGGSWPAEIWQRFMSEALEGVPAHDFVRPEGGIVTVTVDTRNGCLAGRFTPRDARATQEFARGTQPKETCREPGDKVPVADVIGLPLEDAVRILQDDGFGVEVVKEPTSALPPGRVMDQSPRGRARPRSTITLTVSERRAPPPPEIEDVPSVLGLLRSEAEARLRDEGFAVQVIVESESSRKKARERRGRVWKQSPGAGDKAREGSTVTIWVNPR